MRIGIDTNVLLHAHLPGSSEHEAARTYLQEVLSSPDTAVAVTPLVLHELVHVITDPRRFDPPVSMSEALALARGYLGRSNVECLAVDEGSLMLALELLARRRLGRTRIADTLLAATLLTHGVHRLATFNPAHFAGFEPLRASVPGAGGSTNL